ncbi:MAG: hypothetical protein ACRDPS_16645 [Nocardioides sp.]|uniref:hypothetical protein n=1 Tax=Nocardioides sp. TaxID=35761 RepID=UPI003D6C4898
MDQLAADAVGLLNAAMRGGDGREITSDQVAAAGHALSAWAHYDASERASARARQEARNAEAAEKASQSRIQQFRDERRRKRAPQLPQFNK